MINSESENMITKTATKMFQIQALPTIKAPSNGENICIPVKKAMIYISKNQVQEFLKELLKKTMDKKDDWLYESEPAKELRRRIKLAGKEYKENKLKPIETLWEELKL